MSARSSRLSRFFRMGAGYPVSSTGKPGDSVAEEGHGEQQDDYRRDQAQMPFEPSARDAEELLGPARRDEQEHDRDAERQEGDEREDEPGRRVAGRRRADLGDRLESKRDEAAGVRERRARGEHRDPRRGGDGAHLL